MAVNQPVSGSQTSGLNPKEIESASDLINQILASWGLSSLAKYALSYIQKGYSSDEIQLKLQQTDEYKTRFAGNELRKQAGLSTLSPAEYIALEGQYRQVLSQFGLPAGFYDDHSDFNKWIGGDVSPVEIQARAQVAKQQFIDAPAEFKQFWTNYGLTAGQGIAAILDPTHGSLADLQRQANAVSVGGTALQQGINVTGGRALQLADSGVTLDQARQAYQRIAEYGATDNAIANRFSLGGFSQTEEENSLLLSDAAAAKKRSLAYSQEAAQFSGRGGASSQSLATAANY